MEHCEPPKVAAVIVAAGRGLRAGGDIPKQWRQVAGRPIVDWALRAFSEHAEVDDIVLVVHPEDRTAPYFFALSDTIRIVDGGDTRDASVRAGLHAVPSACDLVLIHDAARPCVDAGVITRVIDALQDCPAAAPAVAVTDALWQGGDARVIGTQDRTGLYRAQTPQGFARDAIVQAHAAHPGGAADDVEVARDFGLEVAIVQGSEANFKVTTPDDFARAETALGGPMNTPDIRVGNGYDVHRFGPGTQVTLCGIEIAHPRGLQGHSDADVGLHTITDAIYGALAQGDIGQHFPPSDPQWKGAASHIFLEHARDLAAKMGYTITHVDCTLICEEPKIGPHCAKMRDKLTELLNISRDRISVKATTTERLGFTGRGEGIACQATATLVKS